LADETVKTKITDDALESLRKQIGVRRGQKPDDEKAKTSRILRSQIRHQSVMLGDMRPLFVDLEYAQKSPWRTLVCPQGVLIHEEQYDPEIEGLPGTSTRSRRLPTSGVPSASTPSPRPSTRTASSWARRS
jgi:hypothetical protein